LNSTAPTASPRPRARRGMRYLLLFLILVIAGVALWTWLTLRWAYADGTRAGVLQKFTHRGWICKTEEGELAYWVAGLTPQIWRFSVRDPGVAAQLEKAVGARVQLHYTEHPGVPSSCFADTRYFVDRVTITDPLPALAPPTAPPAAAPVRPPAPGIPAAPAVPAAPPAPAAAPGGSPR